MKYITERVVVRVLKSLILGREEGTLKTRTLCMSDGAREYIDRVVGEERARHLGFWDFARQNSPNPPQSARATRIVIRTGNSGNSE